MKNCLEAINTNPQMTFKAKPGNRKQIHEFIDKTNDLAMDMLNRERPIAEKKEIAKRESASLLAQKVKNSYIGKLIFTQDSYIDKLINRTKAIVEHIKTQFRSTKQKNKEYEEYEKTIKQAVEDGVLDADRAGTMLINKALEKFIK